MLQKLVVQKWERYKKLGRKKLSILLNKEKKLCDNFAAKHKETAGFPDRLNRKAYLNFY
jgi:hypothetical protein